MTFADDVLHFIQANKSALFGLSLFYLYFLIFIPVWSYRIVIATFTGSISWRPLAKNVFRLRDTPFKFAYYYGFTLFVDLLSLLALYALTLRIYERWPGPASA